MRRRSAGADPSSTAKGIQRCRGRKTMNKKELAEALAEMEQIKKPDAARIIDSLTEIITRTLGSGEKISIPSFGTFEILERREREARNPRTGEKIRVAASKTIKFKPGKALKERVKH